MKWGKRRRANTQARKADNAQRAEARAKVKDMSDDDLKSAINRLKLEKEFKSLNAHQVSEGQKIVGDILKDVGKQYAKNFITSSIDSVTKPKADDQLKAAVLKKALKAAPKVAPAAMQFNKTFNGKL
jgi:hypothetical protein